MIEPDSNKGLGSMFKNITFREYVVLMELVKLAPHIPFIHFAGLVDKILAYFTIKHIPSEDQVRLWLMGNSTRDGRVWFELLTSADYDDVERCLKCA